MLLSRRRAIRKILEYNLIPRARAHTNSHRHNLPHNSSRARRIVRYRRNAAFDGMTRPFRYSDERDFISTERRGIYHVSVLRARATPSRRKTRKVTPPYVESVSRNCDARVRSPCAPLPRGIFHSEKSRSQLRFCGQPVIRPPRPSAGSARSHTLGGGITSDARAFISRAFRDAAGIVYSLLGGFPAVRV